jgi:uncharacterized phage protein (TIGR02218 family)
MPRNISNDLKNAMQGDGPLAVLMRVEVPGAAVIGLTSWDTPLTVGGVAHAPHPGLAGTQARSALGSGVDTSQISGGELPGLLDAGAVVAGVPHGATLVVSICNPLDLAAGELILRSGVIGETSSNGRQFGAESRGLAHLLKTQSGSATSPQCRCQRLGDLCCGVNLAGNTVSGRAIRATRAVTVATSPVQFTVGSENAPTGFYALGTARFTSGANAGYEREVKTSTLSGSTNVITLTEPLPFAVAIGDDVQLTAGCDRLRATCSGTFGNLARFGAEPYLPGNDVATKRGRSS